VRTVYGTPAFQGLLESHVSVGLAPTGRQLSSYKRNFPKMALRPGLPRRKQRLTGAAHVIGHVSGTSFPFAATAFVAIGHRSSPVVRSRCFRRGKPGRRAWLIRIAIGSLPVVVPLGQAQRKPFTRPDTIFSHEIETEYRNRFPQISVPYFCLKPQLWRSLALLPAPCVPPW